MAATTLYGMTWFGDDTPTTGVIGGQDWRRPTSGEWWVRNTSNTDWTYMGNMNNNGLGAVQTAGDTVTGPLNGVPNLLPTTDPDVSGTITENGFPLATELSLSQLQKFIMTQLKSMVRAQFLSQTKLSGTATNIAFLSGYSGLLSTLHTNDAISSITRLIDMGVEPFLVASSIIMFCAQRLARKLCTNCKQPIEIPAEALRREGFEEADIERGFRVYKAVGCGQCTDGYKGRMGIYQVMPVTETIGRIIMEGGGALDIGDQNRRVGREGIEQHQGAVLVPGRGNGEDIHIRQYRNHDWFRCSQILMRSCIPNAFVRHSPIRW